MNEILFLESLISAMKEAKGSSYTVFNSEGSIKKMIKHETFSDAISYLERKIERIANEKTNKLVELTPEILNGTN
jgi:hypothetical protein